MAFLRDELTDARKNAAVAQLAPIAAELGGSLAQLAIAWLMHDSKSIPILGARTAALLAALAIAGCGKQEAAADDQADEDHSADQDPAGERSQRAVGACMPLMHALCFYRCYSHGVSSRPCPRLFDADQIRQPV